MPAEPARAYAFALVDRSSFRALNNCAFRDFRCRRRDQHIPLLPSVRPTSIIPAMAHRFARVRVRLSWGFGIALTLASTLAGPAASPAFGSELRFTATVKLVRDAAPSIVNIHGQKTLAPADEGYRHGDAPQNVNGMGTGIVIDERGYILTNHHVVDGVKQIEVTLADKRTLVAKLVAHDSKTDLAVIKINTPAKLPVITIGTSSDLMAGEPVVAVGNAYGYEHTVTRGIISALNRKVQVSDSQSYDNLIQTDASINPGNSGGPLLNIDGEMIGINVAVRAGAQGIGFAIPVDKAMEVAATLLSVQRVDNTHHGIVCKPHGTSSDASLEVGQISPESPAAKCGLQSGDVITTVDDMPVTRAIDLERAMLGHKPGEEVTVSVERDKQPLTVNLVLAAAPKPRTLENDRAWELIGLRLEPVTPRQFQEYQAQYRSGLAEYRGGLKVTAVRADSPAAQYGIRRGDVLLGMHIWETVSLENVAFILKNSDLAAIEPLRFRILRNDGKKYGIYIGQLTFSSRQ